METPGSTKKGALVVVGSGIGLPHITKETTAWIKRADIVLYCVADAATERYIQTLNPNSESLYVFYADDKPRHQTYRQMTDRIVECVRDGKLVVNVFYGHPGVFVNPSHQAMRVLRAEGFSVRMLPAISSLDCLFADLGFDPFTGCQIFEATDLLIRKRSIDLQSAAIIWQIACVGDMGFNFKGYDARNLPVLVDYLLQFYPPQHEAIVYEASQFSFCEPLIERTTITNLGSVRVTGISTLFIPAVARSLVDADVMTRLGMRVPQQKDAGDLVSR